MTGEKFGGTSGGGSIFERPIYTCFWLKCRDCMKFVYAACRTVHLAAWGRVFLFRPCVHWGASSANDEIDVRGMFQVNIVIGILLAYFSNFVIAELRLGDEQWGPTTCNRGGSGKPFLIMLLGIPRSTRWGAIANSPGMCTKLTTIGSEPYRRGLVAGGRRPDRLQPQDSRKMSSVDSTTDARFSDACPLSRLNSSLAAS